MHLPDLVHDVRSIIQPDVSAKRLSLFIDTMDVENEDIITDPLRLNQILLNILSNAIKFTPTGGTISIRIAQKNGAPKGRGCYEFRIKDNGIGMSEAFQKHIFEAFSREESSTVSGIQGTGLGMSIAKNIVDMMGGTIAIESE
ncbi:MAG: sensor histidine kinase, partial [Merdibacter sp.]